MTPISPLLPGLRAELPSRMPPPPPRAPVCGHPRCGRTPTERHHAVARSVTGHLFGVIGGLDWLVLDGTLAQNVIDLCWDHHKQLESGVNGTRARLRWAGGWCWYRRKETHDVGEFIVWNDPRTYAAWILIGFVKGDHIYDGNN